MFNSNQTFLNEMYLENQINEFKDNKIVPYDSKYQVDYKQCDSDLEIRNEEFVSKICHKYGLKYTQEGSAVCGIDTLTQNLIDAHNEISKRMPVSDIDWVDEPLYHYYFIYKSWETL